MSQDTGLCLTVADDSHPDYDKLPESIKKHVTPKEYAWLNESQKQDLVKEFCMPEVSDD